MFRARFVRRLVPALLLLAVPVDRVCSGVGVHCRGPYATAPARCSRA